MANESQKSGEEESGEFADFMADISEEIAQRVESLDSKPKPREDKPKAPEPSLKALDASLKAPDAKPKVAAEQVRKTPAPVDAGIIVEWPNIADRMIEEVR